MSPFIYNLLPIISYFYISFAFFSIGKKVGDRLYGLSWIPIIGPYLIAQRASKMSWVPLILMILTYLALPFSYLFFSLLPLEILAMIISTVFSGIWMWKTFVLVGRPGWWSLPYVLYPLLFLLTPLMLIGAFGGASFLSNNIWTLLYIVIAIFLLSLILVGIVAWGKGGRKDGSMTDSSKKLKRFQEENKMVEKFKKSWKSKLEEKRVVPLGVKIISILYYLWSIWYLIAGVMIVFSSLFFGVIFNFGLGIFWIFIGRGLWKGRNWARISAIVIALIIFVLSIIEFISFRFYFLNIMLLIVGVITGVYLWFNKRVKEAFVKKGKGGVYG